MWDQAPDADAQKAMQQAQITTTINLMSAAGMPVLDVEAAMAAAQAMMPGKQLTMQDINKVKQQTVHSRRIYVGNIMPTLTEDMLRDFFDAEVAKIPGRSPNNAHIRPVASVNVTHAKMFAFVEFNTIEVPIDYTSASSFSISQHGN